MAEHTPVPACLLRDKTIYLRDLYHKQSLFGKQIMDMTKYAIHLIDMFQYIPHGKYIDRTGSGVVPKEVHTFYRQAKVFLCIGELVPGNFHTGHLITCLSGRLQKMSPSGSQIEEVSVRAKFPDVIDAELMPLEFQPVVAASDRLQFPFALEMVVADLLPVTWWYEGECAGFAPDYPVVIEGVEDGKSILIRLTTYLTCPLCFQASKDIEEDWCLFSAPAIGG